MVKEAEVLLALADRVEGATGADREAIARIIDPKILWGEEPDGTTDYFVKRQAEALVKADAITALRSTSTDKDVA